jgi:hypothetical protein
MELASHEVYVETNHTTLKDACVICRGEHIQMINKNF